MPQPSQTLPRSSARYILDRSRAEAQVGANSADGEKRLVLIGDLYIKAHSYMILNKIAFWTSLALALLVVLWPSLSVVFPQGTGAALPATLLGSPVVQTSVTALAALFFALYSHYKKRQVVAENLMRRVYYTDAPLAELSEEVIDEMESADLGFTFGSKTPVRRDKDDTDQPPG